MAPPANRRSGFSRRAQYKAFINYVVLFAGVAAGFVLLAVSLLNPGAFSGLRGAAADAVEPVGQASAEGRAFGKGAVAEVQGFLQTGKRNAWLRRELDEAKVRLVEAEAIKAENLRLKRLLGLERSEPDAVATTRLISSTGASTRRYATIGAGADRGVATGMPVRAASGLIGRVLEVGASSARVLLITDTESLVPVRRASDGLPAFAQGNGNGTIRVRLINLGINPLKKGDVLVTSGSGGLYRPNTPMAIVTELLRDGAIARVLANPSDSDFVLIERASAPQPVPVPTPSPQGD